jgi:hypothetical protein
MIVHCRCSTIIKPPLPSIKLPLPKCAFTSALPCKDQNKRMVCSVSSQRHHHEVMLKCKKCPGNVGYPVYRCCRCYGLLQKAILYKRTDDERQGSNDLSDSSLKNVAGNPMDGFGRGRDQARRTHAPEECAWAFNAGRDSHRQEFLPPVGQ